MSTLRSLRLLGAVEAGTVTGSELQTYLTDAGRSSEFSVLLSTRGQTRRMAASPLTMATITGSQAAIDIVFESATSQTSHACQAVVNSAIAMNTVSNNLASLNTLGANPIAWNLFNKSAYYEINIRTVLAYYTGLDPSIYPTVTSIVVDPDSMASAAASTFAMNTIVASPTTTSIMANVASSMSIVAANPVSISIIAKQTSIMSIIANSTAAMTEINSRSNAVQVMSSEPGAINAIASVESAWTGFQAGPYFSANLATILANIAGVNPSNYPTLGSIIADATALGIVASNKAAVEALSSNTSAMTTLASSPNIGIILSSAVAMGVIGPNETAMGSFLGAPGAWVGLFASSIAKGYIVSSTPLVDIVAANATLVTYLKTTAVLKSATGTPDGNSTSLQTFPGIPSKVLVLTAKESGIAATFNPYNFGGSPAAGSQAGATLSLTAASTRAHVAGYTNMTWNLQGIGVTAATLPIITYVDMT